MAKKTTALAAPTTPAAWETKLAKMDPALREKMAARAKEVAQQSVTGGLWITVKQGVMKFQGAEVPDNKLDVVVLDVAFENNYYEGKFDPKNTTPPVCFAVAYKKDDLKPHPKSTKPQADTCAQCPMNQFGTADTGKGKACQNRKRLAVISADDLSPKRIQETEVAYHKLSVTSVRQWDNFANTLAGLKLPHEFAVATISAHTHEEHQQETRFEFVNVLDEESMSAIDAKRERQVESGATLTGYDAKAADAPAGAKKSVQAKPAAPKKHGR
jgi:hypothetical protein